MQEHLCRKRIVLVAEASGNRSGRVGVQEWRLFEDFYLFHQLLGYMDSKDLT